jgi:hypothetical protein
VLVAFVYAGWVLYSRSRENQRLEQIDKEKQAENNRRFLELYGSGPVKISFFYARSGQIPSGSKALLCYGVLNAKSVELDPPVEPVHVALSYCFNVAPAKTTTYTLSAEGKDGGKATQPVTITVK